MKSPSFTDTRVWDIGSPTNKRDGLFFFFESPCECPKFLQLCLTLCDPMAYSPPSSSVHGSLRKNTRVGCHALLQRILPTQGSNLHLLSSTLAGGFFTTSATWVKVAQSCLTLCNPMDYTGHGIPQARILEWVAFPFSRGSSQTRDQTQVSYIAGRFITSWATREVQNHLRSPFNHH